MTDRKPHFITRPALLVAYVALAAFAIVMIVAGMGLGQRSGKLEAAALAVPGRWDPRFAELKSLQHCAESLAQPANDAFASDDMSGERRRLAEAASSCDEAVAQARTGFASLGADASGWDGPLDAIAAEAHAVHRDAQRVLAQLSAGHVREAGREAAEMDRRAGRLHELLGGAFFRAGTQRSDTLHAVLEGKAVLDGERNVLAAGAVAAAAALIGLGLLAAHRARLNEAASQEAERRLREANQALEAGVAARTAELEAANEVLARQQAELRVAMDAAEAASRAKGDFLASMSHELRTPLNAIIGYAELLIEEEPTPQTLADLERIRKAGRHLRGLIDDVLDLSKIEAGRLDVVIADMAPADLAEELATTVGALAAASGNTLRLEVGDVPARIRSDAQRVRQILLNLLGNACKFTRGGEVALTLEAGADGWLRFRVADTGAGIPPERVARLFEEFYQGAGGGQDGGTGLGLAISKRLGQLLGGDITVESIVGRGSVFTLRLPIQGPTAA